MAKKFIYDADNKLNNKKSQLFTQANFSNKNGSGNSHITENRRRLCTE